MLSKLFLLATTAAALATPLSSRQTTTDCATGVHIIVARASTEAQGEGINGSVASSVVEQIPGSHSYAIIYPASIEDYEVSESEGVTAMTSDIEEYVTSCPDTKIVLMGYSQGAQVVADTLIVPSTSFFKRQTTGTGLPSAYSKNIVAVVQMGDPSYVPGVSSNVGTCTMDGIFPRANSADYASDGYTSLIQSYCNFEDGFCCSGESLEVHLSYVEVYGTDAATFVVDKYNESK